MLQVVYGAKISGATQDEAKARLLAHPIFHRADQVFALSLFSAVLSNWELLLSQLSPALSSSDVDSLGVVEKVVLCLAFAELAPEVGTPVPVVVGEYLDLARRFGAPDSDKLVHACIDKIRGKPKEV